MRLPRRTMFTPHEDDSSEFIGAGGDDIRYANASIANFLIPGRDSATEDVGNLIRTSDVEVGNLQGVGGGVGQGVGSHWDAGRLVELILAAEGVAIAVCAPTADVTVGADITNED